MLRHKLNTLLAGISNASLSLNQNDSCQFLCTNGMKCIVELVPNSSYAMAYMPIKRLPDSLSVRCATLEKALKMNLSLQKEFGFSFVFDERLDQITVCAQVDIEHCHFDEFDQCLGNLITQSEPLRETLEQIETTTASYTKKLAPQQILQNQKKAQISQVIHNAMLLKV